MYIICNRIVDEMLIHESPYCDLFEGQINFNTEVMHSGMLYNVSSFDK